jgi:hypothetical protein
MSKWIFSIFIAVVLLVGGYFLEVAPYRKQVAEFTESCHKQHGVVVEEHGTDNLLCFPTDA